MTNPLMKFILKRLSEDPAPVIGIWELREYSDTDSRPLLRNGVLKQAESASEIPRPESMPSGPPLQVRRTRRGIFGVPEEGDFRTPVPLTEEDIRQFEVDIDAFMRKLRLDNSLEGTSGSIEHDLFVVGDQSTETGMNVRVYLLLGARKGNDLLAVARRFQDAASAFIVLLLPSKPPTRPETDALLHSWNVLVVSLLMHLQSNSWTLPWEDILPPPAELLEDRPIPRGAFCRMITDKSDDFVTHSQYLETVERATSFDVFVDSLTRSWHGLTGKRSRKPALTHLSESECQLLIEYLSSRETIKIAETEVARRLGHDAATKAFERARKKVDKRTGRMKWRCFQMTRGLQLKDKAFRFNPPLGVSYCLLAPLPARPNA